MGVPIGDYTDTDAIRAAIGVTDNEVTDSMLADQKLDLELSVDLDSWVPTHPALYTAGMAAGAASGDKLKANYIALYAQWFCASSVVRYMKLAIPQMISDGKAEMRRFQDMGLEDLENVTLSRAAHYRSLLSDAEGVAAATPPTYASRSIPDYDPVTG